MAPTPQNNEAFLREVDENLRADQMARAARRWGPIAAGAVILLLLALAAGLGWRSHRAAQAARASETLGPVIATVEAGRPLADPAPIAALAASGRKGYAPIARFALADGDVAKGDVAGAAATFEAIANDSAVPQAQRDLARIRAIALGFDALPPQQVVDRLRDLAVKGGPWFPAAGELTALALAKLGQRDKAGALFAAIADTADAPASLRARAAGMATSFGHAVNAPAGRPS